MQHIPGLYIAESASRGRGVFTAHEVQEGDVIEICPVVMIPSEQVDQINKTVFYDYYFLWPGEEGLACMALGYGSLYNHAETPSAAITFDLSEFTILVIASKPIEAGEEIFINYQGGVEKAPDLWFDIK